MYSLHLRDEKRRDKKAKSCPSRTYEDPDFLPAEVEGDGTAELGGGPRQEHFFHVFGDIVKDDSGGQSVPVDHPNP